MARQNQKKKEPDQDILPSAGYIRVSSDEQAKNGDSIRDQTDRVRAYIDSQPNMVLYDLYTDDGVSGQKLDRDDLSRLIEDVKAGKVKRIVFTKLDRWFRSMRHYLNTQALLDSMGVTWIAIDQPFFDTSTPYGRAFVAQSMTWAELEAQNGGLRVRDVLASKVRAGEAITGKVPRGYKIENKHLVFSEEAPAIRDGIMYFKKTHSLRGTCRYLYDNYGISMTPANLKQSVLTNEKYIGKCRENENYCPALITKEDFEEIQKSVNINVRSSQKYDYIFSGLLVCGECGRKLVSSTIYSRKVKKDGTVFRYKYPAYRCNPKKPVTRTCPNESDVREKVIEDYMLSNIRICLEGAAVDADAKETVIRDNQKARATIQRRLDRLKELYLNEGISLDEYKVDRARLEAQLENLPDVIRPNIDASSALALLKTDFESIYSTMSNQEKRRFWRDNITEIRVYRTFGGPRSFEIIL